MLSVKRLLCVLILLVCDYSMVFCGSLTKNPDGWILKIDSEEDFDKLSSVRNSNETKINRLNITVLNDVLLENSVSIEKNDYPTIERVIFSGSKLYAEKSKITLSVNGFSYVYMSSFTLDKVPLHVSNSNVKLLESSFLGGYL